MLEKINDFLGWAIEYESVDDYRYFNDKPWEVQNDQTKREYAYKLKAPVISEYSCDISGNQTKKQKDQESGRDHQNFTMKMVQDLLKESKQLKR